jgi:hypothetical protein
VPLPALPRFPGIVAHRRSALRGEDVTRRDGIPVTTPGCTLVDLACLRRSDLEAALNEADTRGLIAPPRLRAMLEQTPSRPGVGALRTILDRRTFAMTRSELERRFLPIAREVGLPRPETRKYVNGFEVDFFWPHGGRPRAAALHARTGPV